MSLLGNSNTILIVESSYCNLIPLPALKNKKLDPKGYKHSACSPFLGPFENGMIASAGAILLPQIPP
jgi:hypothetical protein